MPITSAYAGMPPWRKMSDHPTREAHRAGFQWNLGIGEKKLGRRKDAPTSDYRTGGWSVFNKDEYDRKVEKDGLYLFRLYNGRKSWVPKYDIDYHIGLYTVPDDQINAEIAKYIESAWEKEPSRDYVVHVQGPSHITEMRYNPNMQVLEVTFGGKNSDGYTQRADTVTFLYVPKEYFLEMQASNGRRALGVDGKLRSAIGIKFWDLIRERGTTRGTRYHAVGGSAQLGIDDYFNQVSNAPKNVPEQNAEQYMDAMDEAILPAHPSDNEQLKTRELNAERDSLWNDIDKALQTKFKANSSQFTDEVFALWGDDDNATQQNIDDLKDWMSRKGIVWTQKRSSF